MPAKPPPRLNLERSNDILFLQSFYFDYTIFERGEEMRPRRYPYSGKIKAATTEIVKAWKDAYSDFIAKTQNKQESSEQELDNAILRVQMN